MKSVLARCPKCRTEIKAEMGQEVGALHMMLVTQGWRFDERRRVWECGLCWAKKKGPKVTADARKERPHA
mgnify:FL=1